MAKDLTIDNYDYVRGQAYRSGMLDLAARAESGRSVASWTRGEALGVRDAALSVLHSAELLAGLCGVVPLLELSNGAVKEFGVFNVGGARRVIKNPDKWHHPGGRILGGTPLSDAQREAVISAYLACTGAAIQMNASARNASVDAPKLQPVGDITAIIGVTVSDDGDIMLLGDAWHIPEGAIPAVAPVVIALIVVGVAATIGAAWWATKSREVEVESERAVQLAKVGALTDLAAKQIAAGQNPSDNILEQLGAASTFERGSSWAVPLSLALGGAATVGGIGYAVLKRGRRGR